MMGEAIRFKKGQMKNIPKRNNNHGTKETEKRV